MANEPTGSGAPGSGTIMDPAAPPAPAPSGTNDNPFLTTLPEELRADPSLKDIKDLPNLAKSYVNAQKLIGKNRTVIPGETSTPEERAAFLKAIGVPDKPDAYGFKDDGLPKDMLGREGLVDFVRGMFHKHGIPQKAGEAMFSEYSEYMKGQMDKIGEGITQARTQSEEALKKEFGTNYDANLALAQKALKALDTKGELAKILNDTGLGNNPTVVKLFLAIGQKIGPEKMIIGDGSAPTPTASQSEALEKIKVLKADAAWTKKYLNKDQVGHKEAKEEMARLMAAAYPS